MVTEFVASSAQERAKRRHFRANRRPHPHTNQYGIRGVVAEEFECSMLTCAQRPCCEYPHTTVRDLIKTGGARQKFGAGTSNIMNVVRLHGEVEALRNFCQRPVSRKVVLMRSLSWN